MYNGFAFLYMEAIYLPVLKAAVHNYDVMHMNRLWLIQVYLYQFYIPDLIRLANDVEENPGPTVLKIDPNKTEDGLKRKLDIKNQSNVVKKSKFTETNTSVNAVKNTRFIYDNILANETCWSNVNTFLFVPRNAKEQSLCTCSLLNLPSVVKPCRVSRIPQQLKANQRNFIKHKVMAIVCFVLFCIQLHVAKCITILLGTR